MIEKFVCMAPECVRKYEEEYGPLVVEEFLDAVLSSMNTLIPASLRASAARRRNSLRPIGIRRISPPQEFDDLWDVTGPRERPVSKDRKFPPEPDRDLIGFLRDYAPELEPWQRDVLNMVREEMMYFIPQMRTKIIKRGLGQLLARADHDRAAAYT